MLQPSVDSYEVGWICALPQELAAARAMLDEDFGVLQHREVGDNNIYVTGRVHEHNVVVACLPAGIDGTCAAATVAQNLMRTFPKVRIGLLVGIGGGIPDLRRNIDIRLGDVVVGQPTGGHGGVIQYAKGKLQESEDTSSAVFVRKGSLNKPPLLLLNALSVLQAHHETDESKMATYLEEMLNRKPKMKKTGYSFPGAEHDQFFGTTSSEGNDSHSHEQLDTSTPVQVKILRPLRDSYEPVVHYGNIASGDFVVKNANFRDALQEQLGVICVEMEAAGLQDTFPCLVIRGICDYADSYKTDYWHRYAAATAAAFAKEFLLFISPPDVHQSKPVQEVMSKVPPLIKCY